ncbi:beta-1,3-glucan-binding protein 1 [Diachasma alloeum]|uniref:beta-1,3-glucan-binding protein 1 n=1 Tax=Diachasma alloeum TaxID=454923 RepID=UPI00073830F5|nr:beta-1,3-glucan-binding protein 1 [Diachasma alloeum]
MTSRKIAISSSVVLCTAAKSQQTSSMLRILIIFSLLFLDFGSVLATYTPPQARVEPLYPKGIRISIPDEQGITLVAFHVRINEEFEGLEAGTIAVDVLRVRNGRWKYEDRTTKLKYGDKVYYWVHVVYEGLGYNLLFQEHEVTDFYDVNGNRVNLNGEPVYPGADNPNCQISTSVVVDLSTGRRNAACAGEPLFEDEFVDFDPRKWNTIEQFSRAPDYPFVIYRNDQRNVKVADGKLHLTPTLMETEYGKDFIQHGTLTLPKCTGKLNTQDCTRTARGSYILPPVASGAVNTKNSFAFMYGRIDVRAKLPKGDWIYPVIVLEPWDNDPNSMETTQQLRVVESAGNEQLQAGGGTDISGHIICGGPISRLTAASTGPAQRARRYSPELWSDSFHTYTLEWRKDKISVKVDDVEYGSAAVGSNFDKPFYITLGVGVGGSTEFPDQTFSGSYQKPWKNVASKALFDFFNSTQQWSGTWRNTDRELRIDYIKVSAL